MVRKLTSEVDGWYRVDLVFLHRELPCLAVIDVKLWKEPSANTSSMCAALATRALETDALKQHRRLMHVDLDALRFYSTVTSRGNIAEQTMAQVQKARRKSRALLTRLRALSLKR